LQPSRPPRTSTASATPKNGRRCFDDPTRDAWQKPHDVIEALSLKPDAVVADIGAGTGYFAIRLASMLPRGRVYAIDSSPTLVKYLAERAQREGRKNMIAVAAKPDDRACPTRSTCCCWWTSIITSTHREQYLRRLRRRSSPAAASQSSTSASIRPGAAEAGAHRPGAGQGRAAKAGYRLYEEHGFPAAPVISWYFRPSNEAWF